MAMTATTGPKVLAKMVASDGSSEHEIREGKDGTVYCTCWSWRRSQEHPKSCKHLRKFYRQEVPLVTQLQQTLAAARPAIAPYWDEAAAMIAKIEDQVRKVTSMPYAPAVRRLMTEVLCAQLTPFLAKHGQVAAMPVATAPMVEYDEGVRIIRFSDDDEDDDDA